MSFKGLHKAEIRHEEVKFVTAKDIDNTLLTEHLGETECLTKIIVNLVRNNGDGLKVLTEYFQSPKSKK